ncbi:MAG: tRNA (adenosine(37)-N6)-threonylcarbamoyltransferase complex ATPase subunit type 1 TsaE [Bacteroidales bacterium]|nr:tRNA (adenosine(37)-N6)-threonylcarbamoyltransferase complex ATPase subunit type 1 TsaE [Bacteroidales bacterium]MBP5635793.1 tRNA (adenosine(37)-N6)-threonylcarbamoyltransferase complex ATPase subunit type 1 TsaE [Bacteroidales bacterium]
MEHRIEISSLEGLDAAAARFLDEIGDNRIIAFYAPMGAGKTTFTTAVCRVLGVREDAVSSPTFSIVNEYRTAAGDSVFHFDFYRITKIAEALDIGFYDYIDSGALCLMEWPENIEEILPEETLRIRIAVSPDGTRTLTWED